MSGRFTLTTGSLLLAVGVFLGLRFALDPANIPHVGAGSSVKRIETPEGVSLADLKELGRPQRAASIPQGMTAPDMKQDTSTEPPPLTTEEEESHFKWLRETTDVQELTKAEP